MSALLSVIGLVLLLLLSPCKVRNYIQAELGIPQTKVPNKSKVTISNSNCNTFEIIESALASSKPSIQYLSDLAINNVNFTLNTIDFTEKSINSYKRRNQFVSCTPLYILYQNFKVYL